MREGTSWIRQIGISLFALSIICAVGFVLMRQAKSATRDTTPETDTDTITLPASGKEAIQIETAPARLENLHSDLLTTGQILFPSDQTVKISPRLQGRVRQVFVHVGDHVRLGQTLAILDSVDAATAQTTEHQNENKLRQARLNVTRVARLYQLGTPEVTQAQATLDQAKAATAAAKDVLERTREQAKIGGFTQKPVEDARNAFVSAKLALSQAQSDLALAERDRARKAKLVEIGVAARSDLEVSDNVLEKARAGVQSDQEGVELAQQAVERELKAFKANLYASQQIQQAEAAYQQASLQQEAAERALRLTKAAITRDLMQARSDLQSAQYDLENSQRTLELLGHPNSDGTLPVTSPISGIVTERNVSAGQIVDQSQMTPWQMFTISNANTVWVDADVYEKDIAAIRLRAPVSIHVAALPGSAFHGSVLHIAPTLDPKTHAVRVRAEIANSKGLLKDGMYADVTISERGRRPDLTVPLAAIQHDGDNDYIYVVSGAQYRKRQVKLGPSLGDRCVVLSGLRAGEQVVTHGALFLGNRADG